MEPRTSRPEKRFETVRVLAENGIPVSVNVAPVIPGLNDIEIPAIVNRAAECGVKRINYSMLRLPYAVKDLFLEWLRRELPEKAAKIENRIRSTRDGKLTNSEFGKRMSGEGKIAESIEQIFESSAKRNCLNRTKVRLSTDLFVRDRNQLKLF